MKCRIMFAKEDEINTFLATNPKIISKHTLSPDSDESRAGIVIFYDTPEDDQAFKDRLLIDQHVQMERLLDIARAVSKDEKYASLKNNTQREIYLFARYNIPGSDAGKVAELLKPEMASVLGGE
jgi:hypothetical protein